VRKYLHKPEMPVAAVKVGVAEFLERIASALEFKL
jgi:hypothetical protein